MRFAALRAGLRTLRCRLTLWNTAVVLLMVIVTLVSVHEGLRLMMVHEADELLREDLLEIELAFQQSHARWSRVHEEIDHMAKGHARRGLFVQIFDANGSLLWSSSNLPVSARDVPLEQFDKPFFEGDHRLLQQRLHFEGMPSRIVRVGSAWDLGATDFQKLTWLMLGIGVVAVLIAPLGGYLLARGATRPIARIIDTTTRLEPARLEERLEVGGSGDELDRLSLTINAFLDRLADYLERNRRFTADAAHELRSPLAAMQSSMEVALQTDRGAEEYKDLMADMLEECARLRRLTNQLLVLAESDAGRLLPVAVPVALDQVVCKAVEMFQGVAETEHVELTACIEEPLHVLGDCNRLRQVVNNLIDNAIKFTPAGGQVRVDLARHDDAAVLAVRDTGRGMSTEQLAQIFERFWQADRARQRGTGLGLSICRAVVNAHGGTIRVASTPGEGACFEVNLPAHVSDSRPAEGAARQD